MKEEKGRQNIGQGTDGLSATDQDIEANINYKPQSNALGDAKSQWHGQHGDHGRHGFTKVFEVEFSDALHHEDTNDHQGGSGGGGGDAGLASGSMRRIGAAPPGEP